MSTFNIIMASGWLCIGLVYGYRGRPVSSTTIAMLVCFATSAVYVVAA